MHTVNIENIYEGNRQRQHYDAESISKLADSIQIVGLLHPLRVKTLDDPILVVGGRRLRAIKLLFNRGHNVKYNGEELKPGQVPVTVHQTEDEYELQLAELEENLRRQDLSWQERTAAIANLHEIRTSRNPDQTLTDTARELYGEDYHSGATTVVGDAVRLAEAAAEDPEIAKAKTQKEATKLLRKKADKKHNQFLAELVELDTSEATKHQQILGDARDVLPTLPDASYTCIITDPPYGIGADTFGDQGQGSHEYDDSAEYVDGLLRSFASESFRVATNQAHAYVFCDIRNLTKLQFYMGAAGWYVWEPPIVWYKGNQGLLPRPKHAPRRCYEMIAYFIKGDKEVLLEAKHDVISINGVGAARHAAEKPVELYVDLLSRSCRPGDTILDPFAGSGTVYPAANRLMLTATGINLTEDDYHLALTRMEE